MFGFDPPPYKLYIKGQTCWYMGASLSGIRQRSTARAHPRGHYSFCVEYTSVQYMKI